MNQRLKELLDGEYQWPARYTFKFIVAAPKVHEVVAILGENVELKESKGGKYISVTLHAHMESSDAVVEVYQKVSVIEGVISL